MSHAPESYRRFVAQFPGLGQAWNEARAAEDQGPLDVTSRRLIKLAIAVGAMREGAVRSSVRKALDAGVPKEAVLQVVALAASTIGFPSAVAVHSWIAALIDDKD